MSFGRVGDSSHQDTLMMLNLMLQGRDPVVEVSDGTGGVKKAEDGERERILALLDAYGYSGRDSFERGSWLGGVGAIQNINQDWGGPPPLPGVMPRRLAGAPRFDRPTPSGGSGDRGDTPRGGAALPVRPEGAAGAAPAAGPGASGAAASTAASSALAVRDGDTRLDVARKVSSMNADELVDACLGFAELMAVAKTIIAGRQDAQLMRETHRKMKFAAQNMELAKMREQIEAMKEKAERDLAMGLAFAVVQAVLSVVTLGMSTWVTAAVNVAMTAAKTAMQAMDKESGVGRRIDDLELEQMNLQIVQAMQEALENVAKDALDGAREEFKKMLQILASIIQANAQQIHAITSING